MVSAIEKQTRAVCVIRHVLVVSLDIGGSFCLEDLVVGECWTLIGLSMSAIDFWTADSTKYFLAVLRIRG